MNPSAGLDKQTAAGKFAITIPVFNELSCTIHCLESLKQSSIKDSQIVTVNNGSTDGTHEFLASRPEMMAIHNPENRGYGFAWNQGARAVSATWTGVMNNDVLVTPGWIEGLVNAPGENGFDVISPAMCEGELDYDSPSHALEITRTMADVHRRGGAHGACFMVHRRVFDALGGFDSDPRLGGYEDDEFFRRTRKSGFPLAITGRSFIHHSGGTTQKSAKAVLKKQSLGDRIYYRQKTGQTWFKRKWAQLKNAARNQWWKTIQRLRYGQTLVATRQNGMWRYR
jgi:GT2 family glycosyltransferase